MYDAPENRNLIKHHLSMNVKWVYDPILAVIESINKYQILIEPINRNQYLPINILRE